MSDPDAQEDVRPPMPPRPAVGGVPTSTTQSQLEDDERYARQLAEHYSGADQRRGYQQSPWDHGMASGQRGQGLKPNELYDREHSFIDGRRRHLSSNNLTPLTDVTDDLPVIKENIRKGFLETQSRVNTWVENFKRRLDGEDSDEDVQHGQRQYGQRQQHANAYNDQGYPNRRSAEHRRSVDRERYDADPHVLGDDFSSLELRDNEGMALNLLSSVLISKCGKLTIQAPHRVLLALRRTQIYSRPRARLQTAARFHSKRARQRRSRTPTLLLTPGPPL